jgi:hypothetical protein
MVTVADINIIVIITIIIILLLDPIIRIMSKLA